MCNTQPPEFIYAGPNREDDQGAPEWSFWGRGSGDWGTDDDELKYPEHSVKYIRADLVSNLGPEDPNFEDSFKRALRELRGTVDPSIDLDL